MKIWQLKYIYLTSMTLAAVCLNAVILLLFIHSEVLLHLSVDFLRLVYVLC